MYIFPVQLPTVSNREDLLLTISLSDDDTGSPIDLSGITLAVLGTPFTSAAWTVIDGVIVTSSTTSITIPTYPLTSNALLSLPLTVGLNLNILPGDSITIQDTATGHNKMTGYVLSYTAATGALVVQIGVAFEFEIRHTPRSRHGGFSDGYSSMGNIGVYDNDVGPIISAQIGNGITITDIGYLQVLIPLKVFQQLHNRTYQAAMAMTDGINTRQVFIGELPVQYGGIIPGTSYQSASSTVPPPNVPTPEQFNPSPFVPTSVD